MPILSADGHLLPVSPEPAWSDDSHKSSRALPQAPSLQQTQRYAGSNDRQLVGVFPEQDIAYMGGVVYTQGRTHNDGYHQLAWNPSAAARA